MRPSERYRQYAAELEDFWGRRDLAPAHVRKFAAFGRQVRLASNEPLALEAAGYSQVQFSSAPPVEGTQYEITLLVRSMPQDPGPLPDNLFNHIQYSGTDEMLALQLGGWGHCQVDLAGRRALAVLTPELGRHPALISRYLLHTIITNFFFAEGLGMLHATGLLFQERVILLMAPHNGGKSTTALRLVLAGAALLTDSQLYISEHQGQLMLMGYPIGRLKLRPNVVNQFPEVDHQMATEPIRGELKHILDLRHFRPQAVCEEAVFPSGVEICLLSLQDQPQTVLEPASREEIWRAVMANSIYYDAIQVWRPNLENIDRLIAMASYHHLKVGADQESLVAALGKSRIRPDATGN